MAIIRANHSGNPIELLGRKRPSSKHMRYGVEIETGWDNSSHLEKYHQDLTDLGLDSLVVSKADGSIASNYGSEIVTVPLKLEEIVETVGLIGDAFHAQGKRAQISGCGVHVHVSSGPLSEMARWRTMAAFMFDESTWARGRSGMPEDGVQRLGELTAFWNLVCLRQPSHYSSRRSFDRHTMLTNEEHSYAAIKGHGKPTIEIRAFKTCRSPKVLRSYPEIAAAVAAFASTDIAMPDISTPQKSYNAQALGNSILLHYAHEFMSNPDNQDFFLSSPSYDARNTFFRHMEPLLTDQGHIAPFTNCDPYTCVKYQQHHAERVERSRACFDLRLLFDLTSLRSGPATVQNGFYGSTVRRMFQEAAKDWLSDMSKPFRLTENIAPLTIDIFDERWNTCLAESETAHEQVGLPYSTGILPVRDFTQFVLDNRSTYPHFAARLDLERFAPFRPGGTMVTVPGFDTTTPHDDLRKGCKVERQDNSEQKYTVEAVDPLEYTVTLSGQNVYGRAVFQIHDFFHTCEGASRLESWAE